MNELPAQIRFPITERVVCGHLPHEDFHFNETVIRGTKELKPRWQRVVEATDQRLGEALGQLFVEKAFGAEGKETSA